MCHNVATTHGREQLQLLATGLAGGAQRGVGEAYYRLPRDCEVHKKLSVLTQSEPVYQQPPTFSHLLLAQWFENVHINVVLGHLDELKGVITSTYGRILKLDSTKKVKDN